MKNFLAGIACVPLIFIAVALMIPLAALIAVIDLICPKEWLE